MTLIDGFSFYSTSYRQRPQHEDYRALRPAGDFGHGVGIIGTLMMLLMLLYSVRKRTRIFRNWGRLNRWLDIHIFFGIIGPLLVVVHTSFKVQGLVAVSFWSMVAVAMSGVLGRYLYLQIPRNIRGEQLSAQEIDDLKGELGGELVIDGKIDQNQIERIEKDLSLEQKGKRGTSGMLLAIITDDFMRPFKMKRYRRRYLSSMNLPREVEDKILTLLLNRSLLNRKIVFLNQVQTLFHYWHVFHKPFAIIMYLIMLVHVGIAVWLGYTWLF
ncbi:MAG: hypothetical protein JSW64_07945 [Candidatus Zixiibacteriota bacterium]|nr:MAG: hypothetical protein JSW64_07945 [candidate division Zixibacteria bacterium]